MMPDGNGGCGPRKTGVCPVDCRTEFPEVRRSWGRTAGRAEARRGRQRPSGAHGGC